MPALKFKLFKFAGSHILVLFVLAISIAFIHQCQAGSYLHSNTSSYSVGTHSNLPSLNAPIAFVNDICVGAGFLIFFFGQKNSPKVKLLEARISSLLIYWRALNFTRPPNLRITLTLVQLGVNRI